MAKSANSTPVPEIHRRTALKGLAAIGAIAIAPQVEPARAGTMKALINEYKHRQKAFEQATDVANDAEVAMREDSQRHPALSPLGVSPLTGKANGGYVEVSVLSREDCRSEIRRHHTQFRNMLNGAMVSLTGDDALAEARNSVEQSQDAALARLDQCIDEYKQRPIVREYERQNAKWHHAADLKDDALIAVILAKPEDDDEARLRTEYLSSMQGDLRDFFDSERFTTAVIEAHSAPYN